MICQVCVCAFLFIYMNTVHLIFKCLKLEIILTEYSHKTFVQYIIFLTYYKLFFYFL